MSGVLEQILSELQQIRLAVSSNAAAQPNGAMTHANVQQAQVDPFAAAAQTPQQQQVTDAQVMALIEPHLSNPNIKGALQGVLASLGIPRLPDARPDQLNDLYSKFQQVIQQHGAGAAQPTSIL